MLIYFKYEIVRYCLLCEKVQIVWSHFKSVQDEYDESFWYVGTFANDLVELVGRAALTSKLESYHPLHFITKGSYTVAFPQYRHWRMLGGLLKKCVKIKLLIYSFQPITLQGFILFYLNVMCKSSHLIRL